MYCKHFGFDSKPFTITPDPRFLYLSGRHREALAHLLYGVGEGGGFVQLTGEVGTGKTTLCRALLEQLPISADVALILNPKLNGQELVAAVCDELHVEYPRETQSLKVLVDHLNQHLLKSHAAGRRTILILDEAQNLSIEVLEQVRLLTNLETPQAKLLQIILIGQPELQELLARTELRQLAQRITARYHLGELDRDEARAYIAHRLRVSGGRVDIFTPGAVNELLRLSGGIPRVINVVCDRALLGAYVEDKRRVDRVIMRRAAAEVAPEIHSNNQGSAAYWPWLSLALVVALVGGWLRFGPGLEGGTQSELAAVVAPRLVDATEPAQVPPEPLSPSAPTDTAASTEVVETEAAITSSAAVPAVAPVMLDLGEQLAMAADASAGLRAWSELFKLWSAVLLLEDNLQPCVQALKQGLNCLARSGNWTQLRSFNRPALLHMIAPDGQRVPVLLRGLQGEQASLEIAGELVYVPLLEIDRHWHGEFTLLWRAPIGGQVLRMGMRGDDVAWLRGVLERLDSQQAAAVELPGYFDAALAERVRQFQSQQLLEPDGVVGTLTLIHLNSADPVAGGPRLLEAEQ